MKQNTFRKMHLCYDSEKPDGSPQGQLHAVQSHSRKHIPGIVCGTYFLQIDGMGEAVLAVTRHA